MQVVIDTNIIVSALLNTKGACYVFLDRVFAGTYLQARVLRTFRRAEQPMLRMVCPRTIVL